MAEILFSISRTFYFFRRVHYGIVNTRLEEPRSEFGFGHVFREYSSLPLRRRCGKGRRRKIARSNKNRRGNKNILCTTMRVRYVISSETADYTTRTVRGVSSRRRRRRPRRGLGPAAHTRTGKGRQIVVVVANPIFGGDPAMTAAMGSGEMASAPGVRRRTTGPGRTDGRTRPGRSTGNLDLSRHCSRGKRGTCVRPDGHGGSNPGKWIVS